MRKYILLFAIIFFSCTSRIDIKTEDAEVRLVIYGTISDDTTRHSVRITRSAGYFSEQDPPAISNALVTISTENEIFTLLEDTIPGIYFTDSIAGKFGENYTLDVFLDFDEDGIMEHYQAISKMPKGPRVDSIYLSSIVIDKFPILLLFGEVFHEMENNFCIYTSKNNIEKKLFEYFMILPEHFIIMTGNTYPLPYFVKGGIHIGDTINLRIDDLDSDYAAFLSQAKEEMSIKTPFFSSPPAEVVTNIRCLDANIRVSGFFAAYDRGEEFMTISTVNFDSPYSR
jgi:hypothetical protein